MSTKNLLKILITFCLVFHITNCQISDCEMPENIVESRGNRLLHHCETNRNPYFGIETFENFYCIYYSSIETSVFGVVNTIEMTILGEWAVEQSGSENFNSNSTSISFTVANEDVIIKVSAITDYLPKIISLLVTTDDTPEEYCHNFNCGKRKEAVPIIIDGTKVREGSWPWHAALYYRPSVDLIKFRCGATIINEKTVITIATCLVTYNSSLQRRVVFDADKLYVAVGETILFDSSALTKQMLQVEVIKFHENYRKKYRNDASYRDDFNVALITVKENIRYSLHVQPICLPESDEFDYDDKIGKVVGWGFSENNDLKISQHLQDLTVPTYNFLTCMFRALNRTIYNGFSAKRNFCAGYQQNRGICTGDSGGGLYIENDSKFYLYGLSSFANCECIEQENRCRIYGEGFFVNILAFMRWIQKNIF